MLRPDRVSEASGVPPAPGVGSESLEEQPTQTLALTRQSKVSELNGRETLHQEPLPLGFL